MESPLADKLLGIPEIEIRRIGSLPVPDTDVVETGPQAVLPLLREILHGREQESFIMLLLDARNRVMAWREVSRGSYNSVQVPVRDMFRTALVVGCAGVLISHNHPSGDPKPSEADKMLTSAVRAAGELLQLPVVDHIIVGDGERYYSFANGGASLTSMTPLSSGPRQGPELD
jgi:DNA repair protein RadC